MSKVGLVMMVVMFVAMTMNHIAKVNQELMQQVFIWDFAWTPARDLC